MDLNKADSKPNDLKSRYFYEIAYWIKNYPIFARI